MPHEVGKRKISIPVKVMRSPEVSNLLDISGSVPIVGSYFVFR